MKIRRKRETGITLIALVISIIVLLILAGVTIAALSGDNGILTRAKEAKEKTEQAQQDEEETLSNMEGILESLKFENVNTVDTNPAGAMPSDIEVLENNANKGIVIKDKNENEWVWIEVPKTTVFSGLTLDTTKELTEQNYNDIRDKLIDYVGVYRNGSVKQNNNDWKDEWFARDGETLITASTENLTEEQKALNNGCGLTYEEYKETYQKMLKSIYTYGGFWIGRYEAGIEGSRDDVTKARTLHTDIEIGTAPKAISQKDAIPYNFIYCSEAQALAQEMTPNSNYTSGLMFGIQWDLICKFLEVKNTVPITEINANSGNWGIFIDVTRTITSVKAKQITDNQSTWTPITGTKPASAVLLTTGASEETKKMNIYDLAGNELEWTLEHATSRGTVPCAHRGGNYREPSNTYPVSVRDDNNIKDNSNFIGFRQTFYKN